MTYSNEQKLEIMARAREALEAAQEALDAPRAEIADLPPVEDKLAKWRREAREQEERFARERAEPQQLTETEAAWLQHDRLAGQLDAQKDYLLAILAHSLAGMRDEIIDHLEAKIAALEDELRQVKADTTKSGGEVIPAWPGRKTA